MSSILKSHTDLFTQKILKMIKELSVTEYCNKFEIARHSVHRRIKKFELLNEPINNIVNVKKIGPKIVVLHVDTKIKFKKR